jgi:hypothetical protein
MKPGLIVIAIVAAFDVLLACAAAMAWIPAGAVIALLPANLIIVAAELWMRRARRKLS